tara:strand:- start:587 stop:913 length:327 start_codon:yes stop_codon:yes gene_type:complete
MTLSKKNLDKLKSFSSDKLSVQNNKNKSKTGPCNLEKPNDIFYSIIDNSIDIEETTLTNEKLKESELKFINFNDKELKLKEHKNSKNMSIELTEEDILYDEFNYLLDE